MTAACPRTGRHPLARAVEPLARRASPDAALVARYAGSRDEAAFAELVRRHGPAVLATCRRVTRHSHDADDAFQATFLVLARKAHTLHADKPLGAWLRGVAVRAGRKAAGRRRWAPLVDVARPHAGPDAEAVAEVRAAVAALPPHQRLAVERCELLGRSRAAVAGELGVPPGTLSSRLALARRALADRLGRRGFGPAASVPPALLTAAASSGSPSRAVYELAEAVMRTTWHGWKLAALATLVTAVGASLADGPAPADPPAVAEAPATDAGRLLLTCGPWERASLLWIDPDGRERARVTAVQARAAGADLNKALCSTKRSQFDWVDCFTPAGATRPTGEVPVQTRTGVVLLTPTDPPTLRPLAPGVTDGLAVVGWSADGQRAVVCGEGGTDPQLLDTATGERTPLPVPAGQRVWGWAGGDWLLTGTSTEQSWLGELFNKPKFDFPVFRVGRDGTAAPLVGGQEVEYPQLSPAGDRLLFRTRAVVNGTLTSTVQTANLDGTRRAVLDRHPNALITGSAWSPDGTRVAYQELRFPGFNQSGVLHLWVCDADGRNRREVPLPAGADDSYNAALLRDWR